MRVTFSAAAAVGLVGLAVAGVCIGSTRLTWPLTPTDEMILWTIRAPRVIVGATVGAGLATAGVIMQGLFRNGLAEPGLLGVGPGAVLGAVIAFVSGWSGHFVVAVPIAAMVSSALVLMLVYAAATTGGVTPIATLLLTGIAAGALCTAMSSLLITSRMAAWQSAQEVVFWMMGGIDARSWMHVWLSVPFVIVGLAAAMTKSRDLDVMTLGEERAGCLGVEVESSKRLLLAIAAVLTGASVAVAGMLGFVGLVVPHIVRLIVGPRHRTLLPASALAGASFVIACDLLARSVHPPVEIRLGIVTSLFGAPMLLWLLLRQTGRTATA